MSTRHKMLSLAVAVALGAPAAAGAQDFSFTYLEGGYIAGFVNDVEDAWTFTDNGSTFEAETDSGGGGFIGGLIAAAGIAVHALPRGRDALVALLRVSPKAIIGAGLALALVSGLPALWLAEPFLTHQWAFPGGIALGTTLVFDVGVYLAVIGAILTFLSYYLEN